jgi:hypothetical protein
MKKQREMTVWYGRREDAERYPDVAFWQSQPDAKKFEATWQMVIEAYAMKGFDVSQSRMDKSVGGLRRFPRKKP